MIKRTVFPQLLLVSVLSVILTACGDDNDPPAEQNGDTSDSTSGPAPGGGAEPTVSSTFDGTWIDACSLADEDSVADGYEVAIITISGESVSVRRFAYTDSECATPASEATETVLEYSLAYPGGSTTTPRGEATHVDITLESILIDGQPPSTERLTLLQTLTLFDQKYDLFLIDNGMLFFGDTTGDNDGDTVEFRPTNVYADGLPMQ